MPAYHSSIKAPQSICRMGLCPLNTKLRGPAPPGDGNPDIVDESITLFRANVLFKSFEMSSDSDRTLVYCTLFIQEILKKAKQVPDKSNLLKECNNLAQEKFDLPYEGKFPLNAYFSKPTDKEKDMLRQYMTQLRMEIGLRLPEMICDAKTGVASKFWTQFSKRKFMELSLAAPGK